MFLSIIISIGIAAIIGLAGMGIYEWCIETWAEKLTASLTIILIVSTLVCGATIGKSIANSEIEKDYYGFIAVKQTYDYAMSNEKISGLERLEIIKTVIDQNAELARKKVDIGKWYSFYITDRNKQLILELDPIGIGEV